MQAWHRPRHLVRPSRPAGATPATFSPACERSFTAEVAPGKTVGAGGRRSRNRMKGDVPPLRCWTCPSPARRGDGWSPVGSCWLLRRPEWRPSCKKGGGWGGSSTISTRGSNSAFIYFFFSPLSVILHPLFCTFPTCPPMTFWNFWTPSSFSTTAKRAGWEQ